MVKAVCSFCAWPEGPAECPNPGEDCENCSLNVELDPTVKERINAVSKAWNELLIESSKDEINHRKTYPNYSNPIVAALSEHGPGKTAVMIPLSNALQKLFELAW